MGDDTCLLFILVHLFFKNINEIGLDLSSCLKQINEEQNVSNSSVPTLDSRQCRTVTPERQKIN